MLQLIKSQKISFLKIGSDTNNFSKGISYRILKQSLFVKNINIRYLENLEIFVWKEQVTTEVGRWNNLYRDERICNVCNLCNNNQIRDIQVLLSYKMQCISFI